MPRARLDGKPPLTRSIIERWFLKLTGFDPDVCWLWKGARDDNGYGHIYESRVKGKTKLVPAHRLSYILFRGDIPAGLVVHHICRNPLCVNPRHLQVVTNQRNLIDSYLSVTARSVMKRTGRCVYGHPELYVRSGGELRCRVCEKLAQRRYRSRNGNSNKSRSRR